jgi:hypothetical protein
MREDVVVEVVARLGDTVVDIAHLSAGAPYRLGTATIATAADAAFCERVGLVEVTGRPIPRPRRSLPRPTVLDHRCLAYLAISCIAHLALWRYASESSPAEPHPIGRRATPQEHAPRMARVTSQPASLPPRDPNDDSEDDTQPGSGLPMALPAGAAGSPSSVQDRGHIQIADRGVRPQVSREAAIAEARMLGDRLASYGGFHALTGVDASSGFDRGDVYGPLLGGRGEATGQFGLARGGSGESGGCYGGDCGTIGLGRFGTIGHGVTPGDGWGGRNTGASSIIGGGAYRRGSTLAICARPYEHLCKFVGDMDKLLVRRYVKRHAARLTYCYEKQLLAEPRLAGGPLIAEFVIRASGQVDGVVARGIAPPVETCVAEALTDIRFPSAIGGGSTAVTLALDFTPPP